MSDNYNEGYIYGKSELFNHEDYILAYKFIKHYLKLDDSLFHHKHNCYYNENYTHIERRGPNRHRYLRPSNCAKFVLKTGIHLFDNHEWSWNYHGTHPKNVESIIEYGIQPSGSYIGGTKIKRTHGHTLGNGIYTSRIPIYAQFYASVVKWKSKYFQTIFVVRQRSATIQGSRGEEGDFTRKGTGLEDVYRLYGNEVKKHDVQFVCYDQSNCVVHALLIKVHDVHPDNPGGEYEMIRHIIDDIIDDL